MASGALLWFLALAEYSSEALARGFWSTRRSSDLEALACGFCRSSLALGSGGIFRGGTGSWLLVLLSGSCLE